MNTVIATLLQRLSALIFGHRRLMLALFALITLALGWSALSLRVDPGFKKMIPLHHPYMQTFEEYEGTFGGANRIAVALIRDHGDIFDTGFMKTLKSASDDVWQMEGTDRATTRSIFTPNVRFIEVVEQGFAGGNVVPATFSGSPEDLDTVRRNVQKAGLVGRLVANDLRGALIVTSLLDVDPATGKKLDYNRVSRDLEALRAKYDKNGVHVHIIGFAKAIGDVADGARGVVMFFAVSYLITALLLYWYSKSLQLTAVALLVALLPVVWLLGLLPRLGFGIDPMSILVPFLIFSIGCSHAVQMTNAWKDGIADDLDSLSAAKRAFAQLFIPGTLALATNALGFLVIMLIKIDIVRELGITSTLGVTLMIVTNKMVLPILLSYLHIDRATIQRKLAQEQQFEPLWRWCAQFADRRRAWPVLAIALALTAIGLWKAPDRKVGDLGIGLPELRDDSRYNRDNAAITHDFSIGVDTLSVVVQTQGIDGACTDQAVMDAMDVFEWKMKNTAGVASTQSLPAMAKIINGGYNEGSLRWRALSRDHDVLAQAVTPIDTDSGLLNPDCSAMQILLYTQDHRGTTLAHIVQAIKDWNHLFNSDPEFSAISKNMQFKLVSGNAGIMVATNEAVEVADREELAAIFAALSLMCLLTFRSLSAMLCIILPLALVSLLNNALMAVLGLGLKVSTLPVIALGVGVGVDYGIYVYDRFEAHRHAGCSVAESFLRALKERGAVSAFTAITMSIGVGTWMFSALKLQADMGMLLSFMFLVNMLGALLLLPAILAVLTRNKAAAHSAHPALIK